MKFYLLRLLPPRPSFSVDMDEREKRVMGERVAYWAAFARQGTAILFGPVADPVGGWGVGIARVEDESEVQVLAANDPAVKSEVGLFYEALFMPRDHRQRISISGHPAVGAKDGLLSAG